MKTLAIRLDDEQHAQLSVLAQLEGITVTEFIRSAIDARLEAVRNQPEIAAKADQVLAEIDAEAATRRGAIAGLFATSDQPDEPSAAGRGRRKPPAGDS
jgi:predicted DNA-binding protein